MDEIKKDKLRLLYAGAVIGVAGVVLVLSGNPANMGFCIACFIRDIAGATRLHGAEAVQYARPEIPGIVLGAFFISLLNGEFRSRSGSSPFLRFSISFMVMIGALCFLGCPLRMVLRMAAGDAYAFVGFGGFAAGIAAGCFFLARGFNLGRSHAAAGRMEGMALPFANLLLVVLSVAVPGIFAFSSKGPGSQHAPFALCLCAGLVVGALAQRTQFCFAGGVRNAMLMKDFTLVTGMVAVFFSALVANLVAGKFHFGFENQPVVNASVIWNMLGMFVVGFGSVLVGGCPLRQLVLAAEGNTDSAMSVLGMFVGAAFAHNFKLVGNAENSMPATEGKLAVAACMVLLLLVAACNTFGRRGNDGN